MKRQDETEAANVPVTIFTPQNAYVYRPKNLLISYISGLTATAACVVVGFVCISKASSEAFSTSFSTIMRTTRNPELDGLIPPAETSGAEPLSKGLGGIKLQFVLGKGPLSQYQGGMGGNAGVGTTYGVNWSGFAVADDTHDEELTVTLKMGRRTKSPHSEIDVDSLLISSEL